MEDEASRAALGALLMSQAWSPQTEPGMRSYWKAGPAFIKPYPVGAKRYWHFLTTARTGPRPQRRPKSAPLNFCPASPGAQDVWSLPRGCSGGEARSVQLGCLPAWGRFEGLPQSRALEAALPGLPALPWIWYWGWLEYLKPVYN